MSTTLLVQPTGSIPVRIKHKTLIQLLRAESLLRGGKTPDEVWRVLGLRNRQALYNLLHDNGFGLGRVSRIVPREGVPDLATLAAQLEE